ncbi:Endonuclease MutS2 [Candidatus Hydrogenisulfobacillus filiaventi]|uniref:Endonuclease MutS2 n=1 Tax=Candidatus Hydrogenisulfobacillus filiaventi TaxID=2707344 RepID=A0A6F8ZFK1_9FIRM|nr:Endonuclease MutS2 [Candidatus Hydrogenisulfobacillus filiaventi]
MTTTQGAGGDWLRNALDLERVLARIREQAETPMGADRVAALAPPLPDPVSAQALGREAETLLALGAGLAGAVRVGRLARRAARGGVLDAGELAGVARTLARTETVRAKAEPGLTPGWAARLGALALPGALREAVERVVAPDGSVRDTASPLLADLRARQRRLWEEIDGILAGILHSPHWAPYLQEPVVTERAGRRVVPVKVGFRNKVAGIVHDQSASGQTVFVEPMAVVDRHNRIALLLREETAEIERLLTELSRAVGAEAPALEAVEEVLADLDVALAGVRYGQGLDGRWPRLGGQRFLIRSGRHPLLQDPVPLDLAVEDRRPVLVITGPNTGGKTVALKTAGLVAALALLGMMVPAAEGTEVPLYTAILADIGDEQSLEQNLSTFASHIARLVPLVRLADAGARPLLALIDEIGAGTDPDEGAALAQALVERLAAAGVHTLVSTHFGRLKLLAYEDPRIQNARVEFDRETLAPTYRLVLGQPGSSHALYIAARLGLDAALVQRARELIGERGQALEGAIEAVGTLTRRLEETERELEARRRDLEAEEAALRARITRWEERRQAEEERLRVQWQAELRRLREEVRRLAAQVEASEGKARFQALEELRRTLREAAPPPPVAGPPGPAPALTVGVRVRIRGFEDPGVVQELAGRTATVEVGGMRIKLPVEELELAEAPAAARPRGGGRTPATAARMARVSPEEDVRGLTVDDALAVVDKFLDNALLLGLDTVRIIHGKGTGTLRRALNAWLAHDPRVAERRLGGPAEGGDGVTVVRLKG